MKVIKNIKEFREIRTKISSSVGFVPTMGSLHDGHLTLMRTAKKENGICVASVFVNPTQFAPHEDFDKYPRDLDRDVKLLQKENVDLVFAPSKEEMYPPGFRTFVDFHEVDHKIREGRARPGFFRGVGTVVTKLFNIVQPQKTYFGQKDGAQCIMIRRMVKDLNIPLEVVIVPTVREPDGLAMSSRNAYLSSAERQISPILYQSLLAAQKAFEQGERKTETLISTATKVLMQKKDDLSLEYFDVADMDSGIPLSSNQLVGPQGAMISAAIKLGKTRLIDNVLLIPK